MTNRELTLGNLLHECAKAFGDRPFVTNAETRQTKSYSEFESLVNRLAHGLRTRLNPMPGHMAIMLENNIEYLVASYAMKKIDSVEVSINREFRGAALGRMISLTSAPLLFTSDVHLDALDAIRDDLSAVETIVVIGESRRARVMFSDVEVLDFEELLSADDSHIESTAAMTDTATILFTSGTTGVSKGCLLSHRYAVRTAENVIPPFRVTAEDCVYSPYPLSHIGPAYYDVLPAMLTGSRVILRERFSVSAFWSEVKEFGVTWFLMLGSVQQLLWAAQPCAEESDHKVTRCWSTPAPVSKPDFDARFGLHLIPGGGYGSTDAGWVVAPQWDHPGGVVLPEFEIKIVDDDGQEVATGMPGQLLVRGKELGVTSDGYFGDPERTAKAWQNGWLHTGDIGKVDEEGLFYFLYRIAERIRVKGEMVSGFEVEEGALTHPDVEDCAAIAVPGEMGEEDIKLFVVRKTTGALTAQELREHCASRMAKFMVPRHIEFIEEMPRTPTGKPEKGKLAARQ